MRRVRWGIVIAFLLGVALALPLGFYLASGERLISATVSPDGRERLELYQPSHWQRTVLGYVDHDYAFARVSDAASGDRLSTSPVFYLQGAGPTQWTPQGVQIGMAARYDKRTQRWTVESGS